VVVISQRQRETTLPMLNNKNYVYKKNVKNVRSNERFTCCMDNLCISKHAWTNLESLYWRYKIYPDMEKYRFHSGNPRFTVHMSHSHQRCFVSPANNNLPINCSDSKYPVGHKLQVPMKLSPPCRTSFSHNLRSIKYICFAISCPQPHLLRFNHKLCNVTSAN
jgi:hypothetical protein